MNEPIKQESLNLIKELLSYNQSYESLILRINQKLSSNTNPEVRANLYDLLGIGYFERTVGNRAENLELAIACYQEALKVYTIANFPDNWATTQNNLDRLDAITYVQLIPQLKSMEEQGLLIRQEDEKGFRFYPSRLYQPDLIPESRSEPDSSN